MLSIINNRVSTTWYTNDLRERLQEHNRQKNKSTKYGILWKLIHYEAYRNRDDARCREKYLKTSQGTRLLKRMLKKYFYSRISTT